MSLVSQSFAFSIEPIADSARSILVDIEATGGGIHGNYYRFPAIQIIHAMTQVLWGSSGAVIVPLWKGVDALLFDGSALSQTPVSGVSGPGFVASCTDHASGAWLLQHDSHLVHYTSGLSITPYILDDGKVYTGVAAL